MSVIYLMFRSLMEKHVMKYVSEISEPIRLRTFMKFAYHLCRYIHKTFFKVNLCDADPYAQNVRHIYVHRSCFCLPYSLSRTEKKKTEKNGGKCETYGSKLGPPGIHFIAIHILPFFSAFWSIIWRYT